MSRENTHFNWNIICKFGIVWTFLLHSIAISNGPNTAFMSCMHQSCEGVCCNHDRNINKVPMIEKSDSHVTAIS